MLGLGRFTEADLIWRYNAIAVFDEHIDRRFPRSGAVVFPMQKDGGATVRFCRVHVHVSHVHGLSLR